MALESIKTLAGEFESTQDLQKYCDNQYIVIQKQQEKIKKLEEDLAHTKILISQTIPILENPLTIKDVSTEQLICEIQIKKFERAALDRELTLEETKRLDLLIKNLHLVKAENKKSIPSEFQKLADISEAELILIASKPDEK